MNLTQKIWVFLSRMCLLLIGILLLATAIPHKNPWNMSLVGVQSGRGQRVVVNFPIVKKLTLFSAIEFPIDASARTIFISAGVALFVLMLLTPSGRRAAMNCFRKVKPVPVILLSMGLLIFTLKPTEKGMPIVLYLTFGSIGLLFSLVGIYRFIVWLGKHRIGEMVCRLVKRVILFFCNVSIKYFLGAIFILAFAATNLSSYFIFEHIPHIQDSIGQVFHGKIFATGKLTVPSHKYREFFDFTHMINDGKWYSEYPPAHSFLMMFGVMLGMPWIINPLMGSLSIITFYFVGKEIYDERTGRLAALLGLFSPFIIFMSSEFMSHGSALFFISLFVLFFARTIKRGNFYHPLISGSSLGMALNGRPMTALAICVPFAIYSVVLLIKGFGKYILRLSVIFITVSAFIGILLLFNYLTTGDPMLFGYVVKHGEGHKPGFGHSGWGQPHTPPKGLRQNLNNLNALNKYLFEWPVPCLFFAFLLFTSMTTDKWDYLLMSSFWALSIAYFFYWFQDWCFGPRFMYESSVMAILLTSRGILRTPIVVNDTFGLKTRPSRVKAAVGAAVIICILIGLSFNIRPLVKVYSSDYWRVNASVFKAVKKSKVENAIVFVRSYYGSVFVGNSPMFDGDVIYVRDLGVKNRLMMEYYPNRKYYMANGSKIAEISPPPKGEVIIEAESLRVADSSGDKAAPQKMGSFGPYWSGNSQILAVTDAPGDYIVLAVPIKADSIYEVAAYLTKAHDFGQVQLVVNGKPMGAVFDGYSKSVVHSGRLNMGRIYLRQGESRFKFQIVGKNKAADNYRLGVDCLVLTSVSD